VNKGDDRVVKKRMKLSNLKNWNIVALPPHCRAGGSGEVGVFSPIHHAAHKQLSPEAGLSPFIVQEPS